MLINELMNEARERDPYDPYDMRDVLAEKAEELASKIRNINLSVRGADPDTDYYDPDKSQEFVNEFKRISALLAEIDIAVDEKFQ